MPNRYRFVISYQLQGQVKSTEVTSDVDSMTPAQARYHLESLHTSALPADITAVEIRRDRGGKSAAALGLQER
ncbi:MAG TPA: hypothetical protein VLC30_07360 [Pseudomonas sp.]|nr:hypothetical protein [Pseudomonas sp.]